MKRKYCSVFFFLLARICVSGDRKQDRIHTIFTACVGAVDMLHGIQTREGVLLLTFFFCAVDTCEGGVL